MTATRRWLTVAGAVAAVLVLDQLSKRWAVDRLRNQAPIDVIWTLRLNYAENTGMAFSKGTGGGRIIALVVVVIVVVLVMVARRMSSPLQLVLVGVVIGGALGNLADRIFRAQAGFLTGGVVDFVDVQWWPIFNVADAAVVVGGIALAITGIGSPDRDAGSAGSDDGDDGAGDTADGGTDAPAAAESPE
jgi:signal peptidase II